MNPEWGLVLRNAQLRNTQLWSRSHPCFCRLLCHQTASHYLHKLNSPGLRLLSSPQHPSHARAPWCTSASILHYCTEILCHTQWIHTLLTPLPTGTCLIGLFSPNRHFGVTSILRREYILNNSKNTTLEGICDTKPPGNFILGKNIEASISIWILLQTLQFFLFPEKANQTNTIQLCGKQILHFIYLVTTQEIGIRSLQNKVELWPKQILVLLRAAKLGWI